MDFLPGLLGLVTPIPLDCLDYTPMVAPGAPVQDNIGPSSLEGLADIKPGHVYPGGFHNILDKAFLAPVNKGWLHNGK